MGRVLFRNRVNESIKRLKRSKVSKMHEDWSDVLPIENERIVKDIIANTNDLNWLLNLIGMGARQISSICGSKHKYADSLTDNGTYTMLMNWANETDAKTRSLQRYVDNGLAKLSYTRTNEGFSYYDNNEWMPEKDFFDNSFKVFCRRHEVIISDKQIYDLCELLYNGILKYSFDLLQDLKTQDKGGYVSDAFYYIRTFIYNRTKDTEHYSEIPSANELYRLREALHTIGGRSYGNYNFGHVIARAIEMIDEI